MTLIDSHGATVNKTTQEHQDGLNGEGVQSSPPQVQFADIAFDSMIWRTVKRTVDLTGALSLGALSLPLLVVFGAAIKCVSRGPILYRQVRFGKNGKPFRMWKLRTMVDGAEHSVEEHLTNDPESLQQWGMGFKLKDDPRVIPVVGRLLRTSSLDELPQLWNVLVGDMSLVGPRPLPGYHLDQFEEEFRLLREQMPPGITGQWQVRSRGNGTPEMIRKWDTYYVHNWSLWLDLKILTRTPLVVFSGGKVRIPVESIATRNQ